MQIGTDTNLQIEKFLGKKGHHHPAMGPVSNSVPPPVGVPNAMVLSGVSEIMTCRLGQTLRE